MRITMKKILSTVCILGTAAALSACTAQGEGYRDQAPYSVDRTAGGGHEGDMKSERVFRASQTK
jgi:hypothetical protein